MNWRRMQERATFIGTNVLSTPILVVGVGDVALSAGGTSFVLSCPIWSDANSCPKSKICTIEMH